MSNPRAYPEVSGQRPRQSWDYDSLTARRSDGLTSRSSAPNHDIQLRVDPIHEDHDQELEGLRSKVALLKNVAQEIESETKFQNELLSQLESSMAKAQAGLTNTVRRLNRSLAATGTSSVTQVVLFALLCFFGVYLWIRFFR